MTTLVKNQKKQFGPVAINGGYIIAEVRHDDECGNGHNSFSITGEIYEPHYNPLLLQNAGSGFCSGKGALCSSTKYSVTTSKHVNQAVARWGSTKTLVDQGVINQYAS